MGKRVRCFKGEKNTVELTVDGIKQTVVQQTKYEEVEPDFIKVYLKDLGAIHSLTGQEVSLLLILSNWITYCKDGGGNRVSLSTCDRQEIMDSISICSQQLSRLMNSLVKKNILAKEGSGRYFVSPLVLARGKWTDVKEIRMQWAYSLDSDGQVIRTETVESEGINQHLESLHRSGVLDRTLDLYN